MIQIKLEYLDNNNWNEKVINLNIHEDMNLSEETLDSDMYKLPTLISYYSELQSEAKAMTARKKHTLESVEASAAQVIRKAAHAAAEKITEPGIKERVLMDPTCKAAAYAYYEADAQMSMLEGFYRALRDKSQLAIALCYKQKAEIQAMGSNL